MRLNDYRSNHSVLAALQATHDILHLLVSAMLMKRLEVAI
jgi:hypothetical protein